MTAYAGQSYSLPFPQPEGEADRARVAEQAMRYRVLTGAWEEDALWREASFFHEEVRAFLPAPELSRNPALTIVQQIATLYDTAPHVSAGEGVDLGGISTPELWALCQERNTLAEGVGEVLLRTDWQSGADGTGGEVTYRVVPAHCILTARPDPVHPDQPCYLEEVRLAAGGEGGEGACWVVEVWDRTDPAKPLRIDRYLDKDGKATGEQPVDWPYTDSAGAIWPYRLYHRHVRSALWDPWRWREVFWGTLSTATLWTFWMAGVRDGSHPQRYTIGLKVRGGDLVKTAGGSVAQGLVVSPFTIPQFDSTGETPGSAGQWEPTLDPKTSGEAIEQFMAGLAVYAGLSPSDITLGSSSQSGYAIVVNREGQRRSRTRQEVPARLGDTHVLATAARLRNSRVSGSALPTEPSAYAIRYATLPKSPGERLSEAEATGRDLENGLLSPVDAYLQRNPGTTEEQATAALADIAQSRALLSAAARGPADVASEVDALLKVKAYLREVDIIARLQALGVVPAGMEPAAYLAALETERAQKAPPPNRPPSMGETMDGEE